ncbi:MAG: patatin-like phospholipase family protein [Phycisphaerales bacterium]|nr:patatin-like phospholipase family protein [Phycisphaerales bacterium]
MQNVLFISLALVACCATIVSAGPNCNVLAMSGGGSRGAYEAGVIVGLVNGLSSGNVTWDVVTGISAGSIVTFGTSLFAVGDEAALAAWLTTTVANLQQDDVFTHWGLNWEEGLVQGLLFEKGLVNNEPLRKFLTNMLKQYGPVKDRKYVMGATSLTLGQLVTWNETQPSLIVDAAIASSSIPVVFPDLTFNGDTYVDGGVIQDVNVIAGIKRCYEMGYAASNIIVDVVLCNSPHLPTRNDSVLESLHTLRVGERSASIIRYNSGLINTRSAQEAYPNVQWRYLINPTGPLPGDLNFSHDALMEMYNMGVSDGATAIKFGYGYGFDFDLQQ